MNDTTPKTPRPLTTEERLYLNEKSRQIKKSGFDTGQYMVVALDRLEWFERQMAEGRLVAVMPSKDSPERSAFCSREEPCPSIPVAEALADDARLYYIQDARTYSGNSPMWWGAAGGYVISINRAARYTLREAIMRASRDTDILWPCDLIDQVWQPWVDSQYMPRRFNMEPVLAGMIRGGMSMEDVQHVAQKFWKEGNAVEAGRHV